MNDRAAAAGPASDRDGQEHDISDDRGTAWDPSVTARDQTETAFAHFGGQATVDAIVDEFYRRMDTLPEARGIRAMHAADLAPMRALLKRYLGEWLGGPPLYSSERGHPRLRARHLGFRIGTAERDAWMLCMRGAIEARLPASPERAALIAALEKLADWMRNAPAEGYAERPS